MNLAQQQKKNNAAKWIGIAFLIKIPLFVFFAVQFRHHWPAEKIINGLFVESGDTSGYYDPAENFVQGLGYSSHCRMPGILPIYAMLRLFLDIAWTKTLIIILQFLLSTVSVYVLARISKMLFNSDLVFKIVFYLYAVSSFVSIWDHVGYADSFATTFLIYALYLLLKFRENKKTSLLLASGFFLAWSVFFRPVHGFLVPLLALIYLLDRNNLAASLKNFIIYALPLGFFLTVWTIKNYRETKTIIVLQGTMHKCFPGITEELTAVNKLIMAWGGDIQPWAKASAGEWFFDIHQHNSGTELVEKDQTTSAYTYDSLVNLRNIYYRLQTATLTAEEKNELKNYIIAKGELYAASYQTEKPVRYYFLNRLRLIKLLVFRPRLDNLPFPKLSEMAFYHKMIKGGYFILLLLVSALGIIGSLTALRKKVLLAIVPLIFIILLAALLRYAEQRYLVPVYPFLLIFTAYLISVIAMRRQMVKISGS
jgi:hypothetical protein